MKQAIGCFFKFLGGAVLSLIFAALIIDGFTLAISFLLEENPSSVKSIRSAFDKKDYKRVTEIYEQDNQGVTNVEIIEKVAISYLLQKEVSESQRLIADYVTNGKNEKEQLDQILEEIEEICDSTEVIEFREYIKFFEQKFPDDPYFILLSGFLEECSGNFQSAFEYFYRIHQSEKNHPNRFSP
jgi:hypothetical protein